MSATFHTPSGDAPSPIALSTPELLNEAEALAHRIAHSNLPARDAMVVLQLAARLATSAAAPFFSHT